MTVHTWQTGLLGVVCLVTASLAAVTVTHHRQLHALRQASATAQIQAGAAAQWQAVAAQQKAQAALHEALRTQVANIDREQQQLQQRLDGHGVTLERLTQPPPPPSAPLSLAPLEARLARAERALAHRPRSATQAPEGKGRAAPRSPLRRPVDAPPRPTPPFALIGIETRGPEHFLSVLPEGVPALRRVRLLQPGETLGGWRLQALQDGTATFAVEGQPEQRLVLPARAQP